ncbi:MAG: hypothetical protein JXB25_00155 [Deltaproteobacteria bacterium]|nr:hypothetical protein [Deltaproteobacteria bacterium]
MNFSSLLLHRGSAPRLSSFMRAQKGSEKGRPVDFARPRAAGSLHAATGSGSGKNSLKVKQFAAL